MDNFYGDKGFKFGTTNPTLMSEPFWKYMVCNPSMTAYDARKAANLLKDTDLRAPVWCFARFGATETMLADGRLIRIGGEHEDSYDPDFQIYNDVVVIKNPKLVEGHPMYGMDSKSYGSDKVLGTPNVDDVQIYGYSRDVFPPTDFHTATYVQNMNGSDFIYIIGGLGECNQEICSHDTDVRVYRLCLSDFSIEKVDTHGKIPRGCTSHHSAESLKVDGRPTIEIKLSPEGVKLCFKKSNGRNITGEHYQRYRLDLYSGDWTVRDSANNSTD